jgi:hypothetical protein
MTPEALADRFKVICQHLELVSAEKAKSFSPTGSMSSERDYAPALAFSKDDHPEFPLFPAQHWRERWAGCGSHEQRVACAHGALKMLRALKRAPVPENPEPGSWAFKVMIARSELSPTELHRLYGVRRATVYEYRRRYGG